MHNILLAIQTSAVRHTDTLSVAKTITQRQTQTHTHTHSPCHPLHQQQPGNWGQGENGAVSVDIISTLSAYLVLACLYTWLGLCIVLARVLCVCTHFYVVDWGQRSLTANHKYCRGLTLSEDVWSNLCTNRAYYMSVTLLTSQSTTMITQWSVDVSIRRGSAKTTSIFPYWVIHIGLHYHALKWLLYHPTQTNHCLIYHQALWWRIWNKAPQR